MTCSLQAWDPPGVWASFSSLSLWPPLLLTMDWKRSLVQTFLRLGALLAQGHVWGHHQQAWGPAGEWESAVLRVSTHSSLFPPGASGLWGKKRSIGLRHSSTLPPNMGVANLLLPNQFLARDRCPILLYSYDTLVEPVTRFHRGAMEHLERKKEVWR